MAEKHKRNPNTVCSVCNKEIYKRPKEIKNHKVYCSQKCYGLDNRKRHPCPICGKETEPTKNTCSRSCSNKLRFGINYNIGRPKDKATKYRAIKIKLLKDRGEKCEKCGHDNKNILQVHHIIEKSDGGTDDEKNLLILCPNCHYTHHLGDSRIIMEAIRLDEEPVLKTGSGKTLGSSSLSASASRE